MDENNTAYDMWAIRDMVNTGVEMAFYVNAMTEQMVSQHLRNEPREIPESDLRDVMSLDGDVYRLMKLPGQAPVCAIMPADYKQFGGRL